LLLVAILERARGVVADPVPGLDPERDLTRLGEPDLDGPAQARRAPGNADVGAAGGRGEPRRGRRQRLEHGHVAVLDPPLLVLDLAAEVPQQLDAPGGPVADGARR